MPILALPVLIKTAIVTYKAYKIAEYVHKKASK